MNPLAALIAIVAVVALLYKRKQELDTKPPDVTVDVTGGSSDNGVAYTEQKGKSSAENKGIMGIAGAMGAGGSALGPAGLLVGFTIGLFLGELISYFTRGGPPSEWPWQDWGVPYWPQGTKYGEDVDNNKTQTVFVPVVAADLVTPATVKITEALLRELLPGSGAYEACRDSGMFCWRPREIETPFSKILYDNIPWLKPWEDQFLAMILADREKTGDYVIAEVDCWWPQFMMGSWQFSTSDLAFVRGVTIARRLHAGIAFYGYQRMADELQYWYDKLGGDDTEFLGVHIISQDQAAKHPWKDQVATLQNYLERIRWETLQLGQTVGADGWLTNRTRMLAFCGFPGAWSYTSDSPTVNAIAPQTKAQRIDAAVSSLKRIPAGEVAKASTRALAQAPKTVGNTNKRIQVWLPSTAGDQDVDAVLRRESGIWGERHVVPLQLFLTSGEYQDEADVVAELESGALVWGPNWSERARRAWVRIFPWMGHDWGEIRRTRMSIDQTAGKLTPDGKIDLFAQYR